MSTRGAIARATADGWEGVYNHFDSYPTVLGHEVWQVLHGPRFGGDVAAFLDYAIDQHSGGWSIFNDRCYCHDGGEGLGGMLMDQSTADALSIEWVYVFSPTHLTVLSHREMSRRNPLFSQALAKNREDWNNPDIDFAYEHVPVGVFSLFGPEPDWEQLEQEESARSEAWIDRIKAEAAD